MIFVNYKKKIASTASEIYATLIIRKYRLTKKKFFSDHNLAQFEFRLSQPNLLPLSVKKLMKSDKMASNVNIGETNICSFNSTIHQAYLSIMWYLINSLIFEGLVKI